MQEILVFITAILWVKLGGIWQDEEETCLSTLKLALINSPVNIQLLLETQTQVTSFCFFFFLSLQKKLRTSFLYLKSVQFSSVTQLCPTLCDPMDYSTPSLPGHHQLPEFTQTHVHWVGDAITISYSVIPFSSCLQSFPESKSFPMSQLFASDGQSVGVSASTSVLPVNTQDWSPLGWTGWIFLQSKGLSRVFSNTTVHNHQFFSAQLSLESNSHIHTWILEKP